MTQVVKLVLVIYFTVITSSFSLKTTTQINQLFFRTKNNCCNQEIFSSKKPFQSSQTNDFKRKLLTFLISSALPIITINVPQINANTYPIYGPDNIMNQKAHETSEFKVQEKLRFGVDVGLADKITNYNRHWAEFAGYL